jgi:hypothetical protein
MHSGFHNCQAEVIENDGPRTESTEEAVDSLDVLSKSALEEQRSGGHADNSEDRQIHQVE